MRTGYPKSKTCPERSRRTQNLKSKVGYGDYLRFRDLVLERSGLHFPETKRVDLEVGLFKSLAKSPLTPINGTYNLDNYYHLLRDKNDPTGRAEMDRLIKTLTVGETYFFRDEAQFNVLTTQVLPAIIARKRAAAALIGPNIRPQLRIWSAGCATGEEPYSLAILLKELLPDIENWHILILGTDINQDSLARAHQALYSGWSFRETRAKAMRPRYFTWEPATNTIPDTGILLGPGSHPNRYRLRDDIRKMATFASHNLIEDDYPSIHNNIASMDLILCRNVTIYFTQEVTQQVVTRLYEALVEGGWLVVGHSEPSLVTYRAFQARTFSDIVFYQKTGQPSARPNEKRSSFADREKPSHAGKRNIAGDAEPTSPRQRANLPHNVPDTRPNRVTPFRIKVGMDSKYLTQPQFSSSEVMRERNRKATTRPFYAPAPAPPSEADPYEIANALLNKGHTEEAIGHLHRKLAVAPDFAPAHSLLGRVYANLGRWAEARRWCQSALELDSLLTEAYHTLTLIHQHDGQLDVAINLLKKAIYLEREAPLSHFNLAMLYKKAGQTKNSQRSFRNTIRILEKWPPAATIPDTGGATAKRLLTSARRMLNELEIRNNH